MKKRLSLIRYYSTVRVKIGSGRNSRLKSQTENWSNKSTGRNIQSRYRKGGRLIDQNQKYDLPMTSDGYANKLIKHHERIINLAEREIAFGKIGGKSGGSALYLAVLSTLTKKPISAQVAATGAIAANRPKKGKIDGQEIILEPGTNLPIRGLKEKVAALLAEDYQSIVPPETKAKMTVHFAENVKELGELFFQDIEKIIQEAEKAGVKYILNMGQDTPTNHLLLQQLAEFPNLFGALGLHPNKKQLTNKRIIAIGEIELAKKYNLPVCLHIREAFADAYEIVKEVGNNEGILHCFTGT
ncbi:6118_t:CDS:2 [Gigaspora margarita]|uniref:6118_t:CDS:1 n=1 Tax=Gigaspora margarita TaxID=4874 RepID=A0ABN7UAQ9_GIGMA|nr:6118_t:CDS:2 [Gigaspora margarita]